jgi:long-chain acyl-CoA synthetase
LRIPDAFYRPLWDYRPRWNAEIHVLKRMMFNNMARWQGWPLLRNITTPTLVLTGERDSYFPRYVFDDLSKMVPGAEVYDVGSAKHKVQLERHQAVNRAIERFIGEGRRGSWRDQSQVNALLSQRLWLTSYSPETPGQAHSRQPLTKFLEGAAVWVPRRSATIFYGSRLRYKQLNRQVNQLAHALLGLGIKPGERVMIVMPNMPQMIIAYYAILKIGGVVVLCQPEADAPQIVRQIEHTGARVLITLADFGALVKTVQAQTQVEKIVLTTIREVISAGAYQKLMTRWGIDSHSGPEEPSSLGLKCVSMAELMQDAPTSPPTLKVSSEDLAVIQYTSGTTDEPKAVCLTHANLVANALQTRHWIHELRYGEETCLSVVPLTHSYGMTNAMNIPLALGATIILLPVFEVDQVLNHIKMYRPTLFPGVPSMYMAINQASNVRSFGLGRSRPVSVERAAAGRSAGGIREADARAAG